MNGIDNDNHRRASYFAALFACWSIYPHARDLKIRQSWDYKNIPHDCQFGIQSSDSFGLPTSNPIFMYGLIMGVLSCIAQYNGLN